MTDFNQFQDSFSDVPPPPKKLTDMLNVLTILTFIGCALFTISAFYNYVTVCHSIEMMEKSMNQLRSDSPMSGMMDSLAASIQKQCEMRLPILIINIVCYALCLIGALQMRALKKTGFFIYLIGEIAPSVAYLFMIGGGMMGIMMTIGLIIPIVFIILYATQLKYLK